MDEPAERCRKIAARKYRSLFPRCCRASVGGDELSRPRLATVFFINRDGIVVGAHLWLQAGRLAGALASEAVVALWRPGPFNK